MASVLLIKPSESTFVHADEQFLDTYYTKKAFLCNYKTPFSLFISQLKLFFWLCWHIWRCKTIFIWFADYHGFLPTLFARICRKKTMVVIGGYDVAAEKEYNYGVFLSKPRGFCARYTLTYATYVLPVSQALIKDLNHHVPKRKGKVIHIPHGVNPEDWTLPLPSSAPPSAVLTIASVATLKRLQIKGLDVFMEVARLLPEVPFTIVGVKGEMYTYVCTHKSDNVTVFQSVPHKTLLQHYHAHKVYAQFSVREGFCITLAEAMLCGCIPVGTVRGSIPEVIGTAGYLVEERSATTLAKAIEQALSENRYTPQQCRQYIIDTYPESLRERLLHQVLQHCGCVPINNLNNTKSTQL